MRLRFKQLVCIVLSSAMLITSVNPVKVLADSEKIITLGADLSEEQKQTVLDFIGVDDTELDSIEVLTITNEDEHEVLDGIVASSVIGSHTYSCAYIEPTVSGGINIKTANLTYVTSDSLCNALQTAGIENCNLIVTAPFEVSGTGALTGVFKAYESTGDDLDDDKKELAAEELMIDAELEDEYGEDSSDFISELKDEVVNGDEFTTDELESLVRTKASSYGIDLKDDDLTKISELLNKLQGLDYDVDAFKEKLSSIESEVEEKAEETKGVLGKIADFFKGIYNFFVNLFSGGSSDVATTSEDTENTTSSIFDNVDTSIFQFDDAQSNLDTPEPTDNN
jgi:uncharacterized protein YpuA (DUF1002 family)